MQATQAIVQYCETFLAGMTRQLCLVLCPSAVKLLSAFFYVISSLSCTSLPRARQYHIAVHIRLQTDWV